MSRPSTAESGLPERRERETLSADAATVLLGFFLGLVGFDEP